MGLYVQKRGQGNPGMCNDSEEYGRWHCLVRVLEMKRDRVCVYIGGGEKWLDIRPRGGLGDLIRKSLQSPILNLLSLTVSTHN